MVRRGPCRVGGAWQLRFAPSSPGGRARRHRRAMTNPSATSLGVDPEAGTSMIALSRRFLGESLTKIRLSVAVLDEHVVWARPNEASNSIGNLMLHLAGNARQWIVSGVGGAHDVRDRQSEFDQRTPLSITS